MSPARLPPSRSVFSVHDANTWQKDVPRDVPAAVCSRWFLIFSALSDRYYGRVAEWFKASVLKIRNRCHALPRPVAECPISLGFFFALTLVCHTLPHPSATV
jgi:hypothetical protein